MISPRQFQTHFTSRLYSQISLVTIRIDFALLGIVSISQRPSVQYLSDEMRAGHCCRFDFTPGRAARPCLERKCPSSQLKLKVQRDEIYYFILRLRDLYSDNDCISSVSPSTIRNIDMWQLVVNFQLILGLVRFRKIVPSWCWQCSGVLVPGEGGCGAGERDWDVPGQGWALASLAAKSWFHRGHASHCWCWSSLVPAPAHTTPYRVDTEG